MESAFGRASKNTLDLVGTKLGILVNYNAPRRVTRMLSLIDGEAARHDLQHLVAAEKRIFAEHVDAVCLISHELKARTLGIENLAAADCEALSCLVAGAQRIVDADEGRARFDFGKNPGRTACLRVERDAETPGDAASAMIVQRAVFAQELHAYTLGGGVGLYVVVEVEVIPGGSAKGRRPALLEQDDDDVEAVACVAQCEESPRQRLSQDDMGCRGGFDLTVEVLRQNNSARWTAACEPYSKNLLETGKGRKILFALAGLMRLVQFTHLANQRFLETGRYDHSDPDRVGDGGQHRGCTVRSG